MFDLNFNRLEKIGRLLIVSAKAPIMQPTKIPPNKPYKINNGYPA